MLNIAEGPNNGPLLFLFHGFTNRWQMFLPILPSLLPSWHVVMFDHRGHGGSSQDGGEDQAHVVGLPGNNRFGFDHNAAQGESAGSETVGCALGCRSPPPPGGGGTAKP